MNRLSTQLTTRYFAPIVLATGGVALARPATFLFVLPYIPWLLGVIMFGMGATLALDDFKRVFLMPRQVLAGAAAQYGIMPFAAWAIAVALDLPPEFAVGLILVGACPGGTASNVITMIARGDVALSVTLTSVSTLLAPILTPALVWLLAGRWLDIPASGLFVSTLQVVLAPVLLGLVARRLFAGPARAIGTSLPLVSVAAIALIVGAVVGNSRDALLASGFVLTLAVVLHNAAGLALGWVGGVLFRLGSPQRRALTLEVGMQNSGLAVVLASAHLGPLAALPGAVFSVWHNVTGPLLASFWTARADPASRRQAERGASSK